MNVQEKLEFFQKILSGTGRVALGNFGPNSQSVIPGPDVALVVCTFEKLNFFVNSLIERNELSRLGMQRLCVCSR